jgi:hypothetical protein
MTGRAWIFAFPCLQVPAGQTGNDEIYPLTSTMSQNSKPFKTTIVVGINQETPNVNFFLNFARRETLGTIQLSNRNFDFRLTL